MIFDECHHARKNHPYNGVMREYAHIKDLKSRPKIFGMTASPYWNERNPGLSLLTLETNLHSKIVGVHEHAEELQSHFSQLDEVLYEYPWPPEKYEQFPEPTIYDAFKVFSLDNLWLFDRLAIPWNKLEMRYFMTLNNTGPFCASLYLYHELNYHLSAAMNKAREILATASQKEAMSIDITSVKPLPIEMFDLLDIIDDFAPFYELYEALSIDVPLEWCSPKVVAVVDIIKAHQTKNFQCIIFVEQRQVAATLSTALNAIPELQGVVRCGHLFGNGIHSEANMAIYGTKMDAIQLFGEKKINVRKFPPVSPPSTT